MSVVARVHTHAVRPVGDGDPQVAGASVTYRVRHHFLDTAHDRLGAVVLERAERLRHVQVDGQRAPRRHQAPNRVAYVHRARVAQLAHHVADVGQQQPGDGVRLVDMLGGTAVGEPRGDVQLQAERRQVMAQCVVQVARDPQPLGGAAALDHQRARGLQFGVRPGQLRTGRPLAIGQQHRRQREQLESAERRRHRQRRHRAVEAADHHRQQCRLCGRPRGRPAVRKYDGVWLATTTSRAAHSVSRASPTIANAAARLHGQQHQRNGARLPRAQQIRLKAAPNAANASSHGPACAHAIWPRAISASVTSDDTIHVPSPATVSHDSGLMRTLYWARRFLTRAGSHGGGQ